MCATYKHVISKQAEGISKLEKKNAKLNAKVNAIKRRHIIVMRPKGNTLTNV